MKKQSIKLFDKIVAALLAFIGYALGSCSCDYGTPSASFEVKGTVMGIESGPLDNIHVIVDTNQGWKDTICTNKQGYYNYAGHDFTAPRVRIKVEDVDGEANGGEFLSDSTEFVFTKDDRTEKGDGWYEGHFERTVNFTLKRKTNKEQE